MPNRPVARESPPLDIQIQFSTTARRMAQVLRNRPWRPLWPLRQVGRRSRADLSQGLADDQQRLAGRGQQSRAIVGRPVCREARDSRRDRRSHSAGARRTTGYQAAYPLPRTRLAATAGFSLAARDHTSALLKEFTHRNKLPTVISRTEVETWFKFDPDLNIAIQTGPVSHGLTVLDRDTRNPGVPVPSTPLVKTHRGDQLYLQSRKKPPIKSSQAAKSSMAATSLPHRASTPMAEMRVARPSGPRRPRPPSITVITYFLNVSMLRSASRSSTLGHSRARDRFTAYSVRLGSLGRISAVRGEAACDVLGMPIDQVSDYLARSRRPKAFGVPLPRQPIHGDMGLHGLPPP